MPRDAWSAKTTTDTTSKSFARTDKSNDDDTQRVTSEAAIFPEEEFVSMTNLNDADAPPSSHENASEDSQIAQKDGKWAWVACFCACMNQLLVFGTLHIYSLFLVEFIKDFKISTSNGAWLVSVTLGLMKLFGPVASTMSMNIGNRITMMIGAVLCAGAFVSSSFAPTFNSLFGTLCVPFALGAAMSVTPSVVIPLDYFTKHQSMAMGLVSAGSSMGILILAPVIQALLDAVKWRRTFQIHACVLSSLVPINILIRPHKTKPITYIKKPMLRSLIVDLSLWKNRAFLLWVVAIAVVYFGYQVPSILLATYTTFLGGTARDASYIFMAMGSATTFSRLATGRYLRCDLLSRLHFKQIIFVVMGTSYLMLAHVKAIKGLYVFAVVRGLLDGAHTVMLPMLTASMVGASKAILGWGYLAGAISLTYSFGPPAAGALKDHYGEYTYSFIMAGLPMIFSGLLLFLLPWAQRTGRSVNVLKALSQVDAQPIDSEHRQRVTAYLERVSPLGSIHDFIREEAMISETGFPSRLKPESRPGSKSSHRLQPRSRSSSVELKKQPRSKSDSHFVLRSKSPDDSFSTTNQSAAAASRSDSILHRSKPVETDARRPVIRFKKATGSISSIDVTW